MSFILWIHLLWETNLCHYVFICTVLSQFIFFLLFSWTELKITLFGHLLKRSQFRFTNPHYLDESIGGEKFLRILYRFGIQNNRKFVYFLHLSSWLITWKELERTFFGKKFEEAPHCCFRCRLALLIHL